MPELRTTECSEVGHPELVARFSHPDDEPHVRRWLDALIERVWDGKQLRAGEWVRLGGWVVELVADGDALALHADDLAADTPSFTPGVDTGIAWAARQREVAESYGFPLAPIDARLATLQVCPEALESVYTTASLVRSETVALSVEHSLAASGYERIGGTYDSGWYLGCSDPACRGRRGAWHALQVHELVRRRPDLVPYLALPPGAVVEAGPVSKPRVGRQPADVKLDPEWNPLRFSTEEDPMNPLLCRFAMLFGVQWLALPETSSWHARTNRVTELVLDPVADPELGARTGRYGVVEIMKRHEVNRPTAEQALRTVLEGARWDPWLAARHRDRLPAGTYDGVRAELESGDAERWKLHNAIARRLHGETGQPFAELKERIAALDAELVAFRERRDEAVRHEWKFYDFS